MTIATDEALDQLRTYLRFPTVNDPLGDAGGDEREAAQWLAGLLRAEGIECELLEAAPGRVNLVAVLGAGGPDSSLTLLSHSDVVPAIRREWTVDPFAAEIRDGQLYGRGVLDLKGLGIAQLASLIRLRRDGVPLKRQIRLLVVADEETGGANGAAWLLRQRPDLLHTGLVLGEGAYSPTGILRDGRPLHAIAVAEKGYLELELVARGAAQHASFAAADSAVDRLVRALARVVDQRTVVRVTPLVEALCAELSASARGLHSYILRHPRLLERIGTRALHLNPLIAAMVTETCAVTVLSAGYKTNVAPGEARAVLSLRLLPGTDPDELTGRVVDLIADTGIEVNRTAYKPPNGSSFTTSDYAVLAGQLTGTGPAVPILSPGASDARHWRAAGVPAYGWVPFALPAADLHGVHGADERLSLESFHAGLRQYHATVAALAAQ